MQLALRTAGKKKRRGPICPESTCRHGCEKPGHMLNFDGGEGESAAPPSLSSEEERLFGSPPTLQIGADSVINSEDTARSGANADTSQLVLSVCHLPAEFPARAPAEVTICKRKQ